LALFLRMAADLERSLGEKELAVRNLRDAERLARATSDAFWDEGRGLFADTLRKDSFSEHAQCLALLSDLLDRPHRQRVLDSLLSAADLHRATIYFSHYLFEVCRKYRRMETFFRRLSLWFDHKALGLKTTLEQPEPSRSDCHAWGAHPLFHYHASIAGIRPAEPGFRTVRIEPQLGELSHVRATMPHPSGMIDVDIHRRGRSLHGSIVLPPGLRGQLVIGRRVRPLEPGTQEF
jgi:hypothetical protein